MPHGQTICEQIPLALCQQRVKPLPRYPSCSKTTLSEVELISFFSFVYFIRCMQPSGYGTGACYQKKILAKAITLLVFRVIYLQTRVNRLGFVVLVSVVFDNSAIRIALRSVIL